MLYEGAPIPYSATLSFDELYPQVSGIGTDIINKYGEKIAHPSFNTSVLEPPEEALVNQVFEEPDAIKQIAIDIKQTSLEKVIHGKRRMTAGKITSIRFAMPENRSQLNKLTEIIYTITDGPTLSISEVKIGKRMTAEQIRTGHHKPGVIEERERDASVEEVMALKLIFDSLKEPSPAPVLND